MSTPRQHDLTKPPPGSGRRERFARRLEKRTEKNRIAKQARLHEAQRLREIRLACFDRDRGRCRACGASVHLASDSPMTLAHCHHIVYRSAGGSDELPNRVILCPMCHETEHRSRLRIDGDPSGTLTFMLRDKHQKILRVWESPCPTLS